MIHLILIRPDGELVTRLFEKATKTFTDDTLLYISNADGKGGVVAMYGKPSVFSCEILEAVPMVTH